VANSEREVLMAVPKQSGQDLLTGNEAVARGAYEAGVSVATAYPGTPSTEILENIARYPTIACQWSSNEKTALEEAGGASFTGVRALTAMKHVGLNVAADPFFSLSYIGSTGGLVVVSADDPGMHSSQNEQDNRHYGIAAKVPVLEPSDSQEAKDLVKMAFDISERFDTPVLLRLTTRLSHSKTVVNLEDPREPSTPIYEKDIRKRLVLPIHARQLHLKVEERMIALREYSNTFSGNRIETGEGDTAIVASGVSYQYAREVFPNAPFLKLSMSYPIPEQLVRRLASHVSRFIVVEENDPIIENQIRLLDLDIEIIGKDRIPLVGELDPTILASSLDTSPHTEELELPKLPPRPPALCPGCPHTAAFHAIHKLKLTATGDIGCYTLGALPPLSAMDTCVCMGASITNAFGMELANPEQLGHRLVSVIGDSTFFHSGLTGLADMVYNSSHGTVIILDNGTTAMTGHQGHPGTGVTLRGLPGNRIPPEQAARGLGVEHVYVVDAYEVKTIRDVIHQEVQRDAVSVVIVRGPCQLIRKDREERVMVVDHETCIGCRTCLGVGCSAITMGEDKKSVISDILCAGCTVCSQVCPVGAIHFQEEPA
jgi:indolepyruvate ferredoxin oxidoreductase alpha subunit